MPGAPASAAPFFLCLLAEGGFRTGCAGGLLVSTVGRSVRVPLFLLEPRLSAKSRSAAAVRLAVLFWTLLVSDFVDPRTRVIGLASFATGRVRLLFGTRLRLRGIRHGLDANVVFLVRAADAGGEGFGDPVGDFKLGGGVHDADGADVIFLDAATPADHRQQPAGFGVLPAADGGAEPDGAFRHRMA